MVIGQNRAVVKVQYDYGEVRHQRGGQNAYRHFYISEKSPRVRVRTSGSCDFLLSQPSQK